jgi:hypothetical protein
MRGELVERLAELVRLPVADELEVLVAVVSWRVVVGEGGFVLRISCQ